MIWASSYSHICLNAGSDLLGILEYNLTWLWEQYIHPLNGIMLCYATCNNTGVAYMFELDSEPTLTLLLWQYVSLRKPPLTDNSISEPDSNPFWPMLLLWVCRRYDLNTSQHHNPCKLYPREPYVAILQKMYQRDGNWIEKTTTMDTFALQKAVHHKGGTGKTELQGLPLVCEAFVVCRYHCGCLPPPPPSPTLWHFTAVCSQPSWPRCVLFFCSTKSS